MKNMNGLEILKSTTLSYQKHYRQLPQRGNAYRLVMADFMKDAVMGMRVEPDVAKRKKLKLNLPLFYTFGMFEGGRSAAYFQSASGLFCLDFDGKGNPGFTVEDMFTSLIALPYVVSVITSIGGAGVYAFVRTKPLSDAQEVKYYYKCLKDEIFRKTGMFTDDACSDLARRRYFGYSDRRWLNPNSVAIYEPKKPFEPLPPKPDRFAGIDISALDLECVQYIASHVQKKKIDFADDYRVFLSVCGALAYDLGEDGRELMHSLCEFGENYDPMKNDTIFDGLLQRADGRVRISDYIVNRAEKLGIDMSSFRERYFIKSLEGLYFNID